MSDIQESAAPDKGGKPKPKKASTHIDMTPMVDLAFLLLTFFMLATTLAKPTAMEIAMPDDDKNIDKKDVPELAKDDALTILMGENDRILYYIGLPDNPQMENTTYGPDGVRKVIMERLKERTDKKLMVLIKPSDKASYKNIVDIFDEMNITKVKRYAMIDITPAELEMLEKK